MPGEDRVDERMVCVEQLEHRAVLANQVDEEPDRLLEHGLAERVVEALEPLAVDAVVLFEAPEVEPVAQELGGQCAGAAVAQHASGLGDEDFGVTQIAGGGLGHQLGVGHARPEEVAQAARQGVVRQRLHAGPSEVRSTR